MTLRYASWCAASTRDQIKPDKFTLPDQLERTKEAAEVRGWVETAGPFVVEGQSRTKYIQISQAAAEIEPLRLMLQAARERQFDVLVMTEFDRLREMLDQVFRTLAAYRIQLYALAQPIEPTPPDQYNIYTADTIAMMIGLSQITSRLEISRTRRKWIQNMPKRITELGLPVQIPFAYRKPLGHEYDRKAVPEQEPSIAPHIIQLKDMLLSGHSTTQLIDYLVEHSIQPPRSDVWHPQTVRDILKNPFYAGQVRFGVSRVYLDPETASRKRDRSIPEDQVKTNDGQHEPLWDMDTHDAILLEFKRRSRSYRGRTNNQFTGLVVCGVCGENMWRQGNGPRAYRLIWRCSTTPKCKNSIPHTILLDKVGDALTQSVPSTAQHNGKRADQTKAWKNTLQDLRTQQDRLEDAYLAGQWDLDRYTKRKADLDGKIEDTEREIRAASQQNAARQVWLNSLQQLQQQQDLTHWLKHTDQAEVNRAMHLLLQGITVSAETITLEFK